MAQLGIDYSIEGESSFKKMPYFEDPDNEKKMIKIQDIPGCKFIQTKPFKSQLIYKKKANLIIVKNWVIFSKFKNKTLLPKSNLK